MSWPINNPDEPQPWRGGPVDQPPTAGASPIPPYAPPQQQPGMWSPQDTVPGPARPPQQPPQLRYAHWGERVTATLIDALFVLGVTMVFNLVTFGLLEDGAALPGVAAWAYIAWLNGSRGRSPGKALTGLRLVRDADGLPLGGPVGLVRTLMLWLFVPFGVGIVWLLAVLWPAWDPRKQALHDKMFSAVVVAGHPPVKFGKDLFRP